MELQILLLLVAAFLLGCIAGHVLRGVAARRRVARATTVRQPTERRPTRPTASKARTSPARAPTRDDLKLLSGIGPALEKRLNRHGIRRFEQIANWSEDEIAEFDEKLDFKGRIAREQWVAQARILATGGDTEFSRRARAKGGKLRGGKGRA